jgi:S1-C subfamily serine protease
MKYLKISVRMLLSLLVPAFLANSRADEISQKGREVFQRFQHTIVTVQVVLKASYSSSGRSSPASETRQEVTGTVVDPSGLTVLSLTACDPAEMYQRVMSDSGYKVETEITDIKILQDDNTEIPAEIVLRDNDWDLAFIRPKVKPSSPFTAMDLSDSAKAQVLDQVLAIGRLNRAAGRAYSASVERISAIISKPRTFYIPDSAMTATALGSPALTLDGKVLGIFVMRGVAGHGSSTRDYRQSITSIILPASDILKSAKQAPEAKNELAPARSAATNSPGSSTAPEEKPKSSPK